MKLSEHMILIANKVYLVDGSLLAATGDEVMRWSNKVAQLEAENEALKASIRRLMELEPILTGGDDDT